MIKASRDSKCQTLEHRARNIPMNMSHISFKTLCVPCDVTHFLQNIVSHVTQQMDRETIQKANNLHTADFRRQAAGLEIGRKFRWQLAAIYKQFRKQFTDNPSGTQLKGKHAKEETAYMWPLEDSLLAGNLWHIILGDSLQLYRSNLETKTVYRQCTMNTT